MVIELMLAVAAASAPPPTSLPPNATRDLVGRCENAALAAAESFRRDPGSREHRKAFLSRKRAEWSAAKEQHVPTEEEMSSAHRAFWLSIPVSPEGRIELAAVEKDLVRFAARSAAICTAMGLAMRAP